jgi:hypothetical protein
VIAAAVIAGVLGSPPGEPADADTGTIELAWHGIAGCPDAIAVRERWEAALAGTEARVRIDAAVERTADARWRLALEVTGPAGRGAREIVADSCDALVEAAGVIVGMVGTGALADAVDVPSVEPRTVAPAIEAPTHEPTPASGAATPAPSATRRLVPGWGVRIGGAFDLGVLPSLGATIGGEVSAEWRRLRVTLGGLHAITRRREEDDGAGAFAIGAGTIGAGPVLRRDPIALAAMARLEVGVVRAEGEGVRTTYLHRHLWTALDLGAELGWSFARDWVLGVSAAAVFPLRRWRFAIGDASFGAIGPVGGRFGLFLGWRRLPPVRKNADGGQR